MRWRWTGVSLQASPSVLRSYSAQSMLRIAEQAAERTYAALRVLILVALVVLFFGMEEVHDHSDLGSVSLILYGLLTVLCLLLAWLRIYRQWMPYAFVSFDIVLIGIHLIEMTKDLGMAPTMLFGIPASGLLVLVLVHSAMRLRPSLVIYAGAASVSLALSTFAIPHLGASDTSPGLPRADVIALAYWLGLPTGVLAATTVVLWRISRTMATLLDAAIAQAGHAARLSRYFSPNLIDQLSSDRRSLELAGRRCVAAILFIDIRGFTAMSEKMPPDQIGAVLTEFRTIVAEHVFVHEGTVDKFIGDAVMAVFGTPEQRHDDPSRAVRCGMSILQAVHARTQQRTWPYGVPLRVGIGGHYGEVYAGVIGDKDLLEFTVLGDTVNVAERLQKLCSDLGGKFVISESLFRESHSEGDAWKLVHNVHIAGRSKEITVYMQS